MRGPHASRFSAFQCFILTAIWLSPKSPELAVFGAWRIMLSFYFKLSVVLILRGV